jgi:hypothetical protein
MDEVTDSETVVVENASWNTQGLWAGHQNIYWHTPDASCFQTLPKMEYLVKPGDRVTFYYGRWYYDTEGRPSSRAMIGFMINDQGPMVTGPVL